MPTTPLSRNISRLLAVTVVFAAVPAAAQHPTPVLTDLGRYLLHSAPAGEQATPWIRLEPDSEIAVTTADGETILGTFVSASSSQMTLRSGGLPRQIATGNATRVVVAHGSRHRKAAIAVGAVVGMYIGTAPCYRTPAGMSADEGAPCGPWPFVGAALGGILGRQLGGHWSPAIVYASTPEGPPRRVAEWQALQEPETRSLRELSSRLLPFETVYVKTTDGRNLKGRFQFATGNTLSVDEGGRTRTIPAGDIQQIRRRGGTQGKRGMMTGAGLMGGLATLLILGSGEEGEGALAGAFVIAAAGGGAFWGGIIGLTQHSRPVVYRADAPTVRAVPFVAPGRAGAMISASF